MTPQDILYIAIILIVFYLAGIAFSYWFVMRIKRNVEMKESEVKHRMYELAILKEIADRTGYSLNIQKILDVIEGSLNQFLEYDVAAYMLLNPDKIIFKSHVQNSVSPQFIKEVRDRMTKSIAAILGRDLSSVPVEETITGALMLENADLPVRSYFNIPLVIGGDLVGVLTIAHRKDGFYKEEEMSILYKIVSQASQAVTKLEETVKTEQKKTAAMIESMIEGVVMTDRDYRIIAANAAARRVIGYGRAEVPTIFDFIEGLSGAFDIKGKLEEAIKLDKPLTFKDVMFRGTYYEVLISPVKSDVGVVKDQILGGVVVFHDITHEKEAEKMRDDFTSMIVHELRSPLGNIKKIGELMKSTKVLEDKQMSSEYVRMLSDSSSSMLVLLNDLLDAAKISAGKFAVEKKETNLKELLEGCVKFFDTAARDGKIGLSLFFDANAPTTALFDPVRMTQVVNNFLSNALNFTPREGKVAVLCFLHKKGNRIDEEAATLRLPWIASAQGFSTDALPGCLVVAVTDSGEGIAPENLDKLFNKFTQFVSTARENKHRGTGLGLVIAKGIIEAHGGTIKVGSVVGKGTTVYATINL